MKIQVKTEQKYSETEQGILAYLFEHPEGNVGTYSLMKALKADRNSSEAGWQTSEAQRQAYEEIEFGIETLIKDRLAKGKRAAPAGNIEFSKLELTPAGEAEAIGQKRKAKDIEIISTIPRPNRTE